MVGFMARQHMERADHDRVGHRHHRPFLPRRAARR
jgi:hypothetical protein